MRRFIRDTVAFSVLPVSLIAVSFFLANGTTDPFYLKFTTPKQVNLIVGTSRAAQGLQPQVIDSVFNGNGIAGHLFNYSFTLVHSPYGPVYYESIKKKLDETAKNGMYIVAVDPWSISSKRITVNGSETFDESSLCLGKIKTVNSFPNIDYLLNAYPSPLFSIYVSKVKDFIRKPNTVLHKDGWLEVTVNMDSATAKARLKKMRLSYDTCFVPYYHFSSERFAYLEKTIDLFTQHGSVFLVRLPVDSIVTQMDDVLIPNFDSIMGSLATRKHISYINYREQSNKYQYTDGNHLYKSSGQELSKTLAETILNIKKKSIDNPAQKNTDKTFLTSN